MTDVDPIEGERFDRGRWPFPVREPATKMMVDVERVSCWNNWRRRCVHPSIVTRTTFCIDCNTFLFIEPGSIYEGPVVAPPATFLGPVPAGETVHGTADADRAGFASERHALDQETAAEHIKNALQLLTGNGDEDRAHLLVLVDAVRARLARALAALEGTP